MTLVAALYGAPATLAQGLDLGLDLGGLGVDLEVGGDSGLDLDVDLGDGGLDLDLGGSDDGGLLDLSAGLPAQPLSQNSALQAVRTQRALPLEDIMLRARLLTDGEIIDARLVSMQDILLYEIKVLGKAGDVSALYFYARSGIPVETN